MKIEDLANKEFEITEEGLLKVVEKKVGKFVPKDGDKYWIVTQYGKVLSDIYSNCEGSRCAINRHSVFRTKEEAEEYKHYLVVLSEYKHEFTYEEWKDSNINKWYLVYDTARDAIFRFVTTDLIGDSRSYFKTIEDTEYFIRKAGRENVKKFMFDVWE